MQPKRLTPPWNATSSEGLLAPEHLAEALMFDPEGNSVPPGGPAWSKYGIWLWPHTLLLWPPGTDKPSVAVGSVVVADRHPALSRAALLWCASLIDLGQGVVLCGRTLMAVESGRRLIEPLIGGAGSA
jgi:hypothetical protein